MENQATPIKSNSFYFVFIFLLLAGLAGLATAGVDFATELALGARAATLVSSPPCKNFLLEFIV